jgi:hypothetical protein
MTKLVYRIDANGNVEGLLKDTAIDSRIFAGRREIHRITLIEHDPDEQKFHIQWLAGPFKGQYHDNVIDASIFDRPTEGDPLKDMLFDTYEEAVEHEIRCVNALRHKGENFKL